LRLLSQQHRLQRLPSQRLPQHRLNQPLPQPLQTLPLLPTPLQQPVQMLPKQKPTRLQKPPKPLPALHPSSDRLLPDFRHPDTIEKAALGRLFLWFLLCRQRIASAMPQSTV
jgi:hypothetical protein